jgi:hypothetical protein
MLTKSRRWKSSEGAGGLDGQVAKDNGDMC